MALEPHQIRLDEMDDSGIAALAVRCLDSLPSSDRVKAILKSLHNIDDCRELASWLEDAIIELEDEEGEN